jgi:hypothetical protein
MKPNSKVKEETLHWDTGHTLKMRVRKPNSPEKAYKNGWDDGFQIGYRQREKEVGGSKVLEGIKSDFIDKFSGINNPYDGESLTLNKCDEILTWFLPYLTAGKKGKR